MNSDKSVNDKKRNRSSFEDRFSSEEDSNGIDFHQSDNISLNNSKHISAIQGCRSVDNYKKLNIIDEGTYDKGTGNIVALKRIKLESITKSTFPITSLREINILQSLRHPNILRIKEIVIGKKISNIYLVMEYIDHDLKQLMLTLKYPFAIGEVKCLMLQLLSAVEYLHRNWIIHRDLKSSNLLMTDGGVLKICDFGLARKFGSPIGHYTDLVVTLWYRAPELLLAGEGYTKAIDIWSIGCIMAELLLNEPLFPGANELDQLDKIFSLLGTPNETIWPGFSELKGAAIIRPKNYCSKLKGELFCRDTDLSVEKFPRSASWCLNAEGATPGIRNLTTAGFNLLSSLLLYDPKNARRVSARDALKSVWFKEEPLPIDPVTMPKFDSLNEESRIGKHKTFKQRSPSQFLAPRSHSEDKLFGDFQM